MKKIYPLPSRFRDELREFVLDALPEILDRYFGDEIIWSPAGFAKVRRGLFVYADGFFADCAASVHGDDPIVLLAHARGETEIAPALLSVLEFLAGDNDRTARLLLAELSRLDHARRSLPVAPIVERFERHGKRYAVVQCPFCRRLHVHGDDYGARGAHCISPVNSGEYCIDEASK